MTNRRQVLAGLAGMSTSIVAAADGGSKRALDLDDPATNLLAYVKLRGSLDSEPVYDIVRGQVFALVAGEQARPLFKMIGAQRSTYARQSTLAYAASTHYLGWLLDWQTERPLQAWSNPWTGEHCEVPATRYGPSSVRILADRMVPSTDASEALPGSRRPWFLMGGVVHMLDEIVMPAPAEALYPKADLMTFSGDCQHLVDPARSRITSRLSFSAVEGWRDWMQMDRPGVLWWHVAGIKLDGPQAYPPELKALLDSADPKFFQPIAQA